MENKKPGLFARLQNKITRSYGIALVVLLALMVVLSLTTDGNFLTYENIFNLSRATSVYGIVALAMTFVIITGGIDLSVGANVGLAGMLVTLLTVNHGFNMWLTMLIAVVACAMVGLLNGILIYDGKLPPFIATLGSMTIIRAVILLISDSRNITGLPEEFLKISKITIGFTKTNNLGMPATYGIPFMALVWLLLILASAAIFKYTYFGRNIFAVGSNCDAARLSGISVRKTIYGVYVSSGVLCALGGILLTSRLASGIPTLGTGYEMNAIAAAVVGGASMSGGVGYIGGTVIGAILIATIRNGGTLWSLNGQIIEILIGCLIIAAVLMDKLKKTQ